MAPTRSTSPICNSFLGRANSFWALAEKTWLLVLVVLLPRTEFASICVSESCMRCSWQASHTGDCQEVEWISLMGKEQEIDAGF